MLRKRNVHKNNAARRFAGAKAQSAMEYLMTYGWAILIIAVVLGALFQLGVFNASNFAPKAPPGACQVFRPNGPGTTSFINLEGVCSGELPQYVAVLPTNTAYITVNKDFPVFNGGTFSVLAWVYWPYTTAKPNNFWFNRTIIAVGYCGSTDNTFTLALNGIGQWYAYFCHDNELQVSMAVPGKWYQVAVTFYNATKQFIIYVNGNSAGSVIQNNAMLVNAPFGIGGAPYSYSQSPYNVTFDGYISNVQLYNTSLSANEIQALYLEGIGGAPINLQHLVGWWPLNGNANDYSGNGNNGVPTAAVSFVSNWWSSYTPP